MKVLGIAAINRDLIVISRQPVTEFEEAIVDYEKFLKIEQEAKTRPHFVRLGGSVVNTLYTLATCGLDVYVFGRVGSDKTGRLLLKLLSKYGMRFIGTVALGRSGRTVIMSDLEGHRHIYVYPGVNDELCLLDVETTGVGKLVAEADLVHTSTFVCSRGLEPLRLQVSLMGRARGLRSLVLGTLYTSLAKQSEEARDLLLKLIERIDILFLSETELRELSHVLGETTPERLFSISGSLEYVFLTRGGEEVIGLSRHGGEVRLHPPSVELVDTTGAGDAFAGGVLLGLLAGRSLRECVQLGLENAAVCIQSIGGTGFRVPRVLVEIARAFLKR